MKLNLKQIASALKGKDINAIIKNICGEKIGTGQYRDVYELKINPKYVVKIERDVTKGNFCNVTEWRNYIEHKDWDWFGHWLAPCELINETGQVLIQRRAEFKRRKDYPKYVPKMFVDLKVNNFGWIGDRFVCFDYPYLKKLVYSKTYSPTPMMYANWKGSLRNPFKPLYLKV